MRKSYKIITQERSIKNAFGVFKIELKILTMNDKFIEIMGSFFLDKKYFQVTLIDKNGNFKTNLDVNTKKEESVVNQVKLEILKLFNSKKF